MNPLHHTPQLSTHPPGTPPFLVRLGGHKEDILDHLDFSSSPSPFFLFSHSLSASLHYSSYMHSHTELNVGQLCKNNLKGNSKCFPLSLHQAHGYNVRSSTAVGHCGSGYTGCEAGIHLNRDTSLLHTFTH